MPIDKDATFIWLMQPQQHVGEGRFTSAAPAYNRHRLTVLDFKIDVLESVLVGARGVAKRNIVEFDVTADARHFHASLSRRVFFGFCIEHVVESFECNIDLLKLAP